VISAYSAQIQLNAHSNQLNARFTLSSRWLLTDSSYQFGCQTSETLHHIFTQCPQFDAYCHNTMNSLINCTMTILNFYGISTEFQTSLLSFLQEFNLNTAPWPTHQSLYYLGLCLNSHPYSMKATFMPCHSKDNFYLPKLLRQPIWKASSVMDLASISYYHFLFRFFSFSFSYG